MRNFFNKQKQQKTRKMATPQLFTALVILVQLALFAQITVAGIVHYKYSNGNNYLHIELLQDNTVHFEYAAGTGPAYPLPEIYTSPMIAKTGFAGPSYFDQQGTTVQTGDLTLTVEYNSLCLSVYNKRLHMNLTVVCPQDLTQPTKRLSIAKYGSTAIYGLGEQFWTGGDADGTWLNRVRSPNCGFFGNAICEY